MKSYLINLDRSSARWGRMSDRFAAIGLAFERVPAVDGGRLGAAEISDVYRPVLGAAVMTPGEIGCFLSHRRCWELIASGPDPFGCIFEDDVLVSPHTPLFLGDDASWIPADADIVKIETAGGNVWFDRAVSPLAKNFNLGLLRSFHFGSGGYILSKAGAERLLTATRIFSDAVDHVKFNPACGIAGRLKSYQVLPALCIQTGMFYPAGSDRIEPPDLTEHSTPRFPENMVNSAWLKRKSVSAFRRMAHKLRRHWRTKVLFADESWVAPG
jgi:glycosyl transferase family 25